MGIDEEGAVGQYVCDRHRNHRPILPEHHLARLSLGDQIDSGFTKRSSE
jgi:hypothetical protein